MPAEPILIKHRLSDGSRAAIVFVHGFSGDATKTWGRFLEFVAAEPGLKDWDIFSIGYDSHLAPDIRGVWASDPAIPELALFLKTRLTLDRLGRYEALAFVAHSMGGLIVQRALLDHAEVCDRTTHLFLFGTPSAGLSKAGRFAFLKKSIKGMAHDGEFIRTLRADWSKRFPEALPFKFWTVAGARDEFVPPQSSLEPFPLDRRVVVIGDHLRVVKPEAAADMGVRVVCEGIVGDAAPGGVWNSALVAVEAGDFKAAIARLEPNADKLDDAHLVQLALALEKVGRAKDAVAYLNARPNLGTDARGVLAGRLKRRWRTEGIASDGTEALALYAGALEHAVAAGDHAQAYYHAVNVAFMQLAFQQDHGSAAKTAETVLDHSAHAPPSFWRDGSEGDAHQFLSDFDAAIAAYERAVALNPSPRETESMYEQAYLIAGLLGREDVQHRIDGVFRPAVPKEPVVGEPVA